MDNVALLLCRVLQPKEAPSWKKVGRRTYFPGLVVGIIAGGMAFARLSALTGENAGILVWIIGFSLASGFLLWVSQTLLLSPKNYWFPGLHNFADACEAVFSHDLAAFALAICGGMLITEAVLSVCNGL